MSLLPRHQQVTNGGYLIAGLSAIGVSWFLFALMQWLVSSDTMFSRPTRDAASIDFVRIKHQAQSESRQRRLPEPPPPPPPQAPRHSPTVAVQAQDTAPSLVLPQASFEGVRLPTTPFLGALQRGPISQGLVPIVPVTPIYPRRALVQGIEGEVKVEFTIGVDGNVSDIAIVSAEPPGIFETAVIRALSRARYKPFVVDGKAVAQRAIQTIPFRLE